MTRTYALIAAGLAAIAVAASTGDLSPKMRAHAEALASAPGLHAKFNVVAVGGASADYEVQFAKPDKARISTPAKLVVADGTTLTTYDRAGNSYTRQKQSPELLMAEFASPELGMWLTFFDPKACDRLAATKDLGKKKLRGMQLDAVDVVVDPKGETTASLYLDPADSMPRVAEIHRSTGTGKVSHVVSVTEISLDAPAAEVFAFTPPAGAKEVDLSAMKAGEWLHNLDEALKLAKASGKLVLVDFMAEWCGPCKRMEKEVFQSAKFKETCGDFILVKIDIDEQPALAQKYGVSSIPNVKFLKADGSVAHEFLGYASPEQVYGELDKARSKKG